MSARELALQILSRLNTGRGRARDLLNKKMREQELARSDRAFLSELVYGTIRWRGNLDWIIRQFISPRNLKKLQPEIADILRLGLYQLFFLGGVPDHAAVNESVELAKKYGHKGASGLVNAVLRKAARNKGKIAYPDISAEPIKHISARYSHPEWLVKRWIERFGVDETVQLCSANNLRAPLYIRANLIKTSREQLIKSLEKEGAAATASCNLSESVELAETPLPVNELLSYKQGWFQVQDESSMLASHILNPQPGEVIIDVCAAPGGKTTHIAELMQNKGRIWAFDTDEHRLPLVSESCQRLGISIAKTVKADARKLDKLFPEKKADRVIADVPCTGLGVLRRRVESRWRRTPDELKAFPERQYAILVSAARCLKPGGVLVYCTCSIEPEENQQVVARFLEAHPRFQAQNILPFLPVELQERNLVSEEGYLQTYPHLHDMDGFFAVKMEKHAH